MARAHSVWIVSPASFDNPIAAFTVKHELITWLTRMNAEGSYTDALIHVLHDGHPGVLRTMTFTDLIT